MYLFLKFVLEEFKRVKAHIPPIFDVLIAPRLTALDEVLMPGCLSFTWASPNVDQFCESMEHAVRQFELMCTRIQELVTYRIEAVLHDISTTNLIDLNEEEAVTVEEFLERTEGMCSAGTASIQVKSTNVEEATEELLQLIYPDYKTRVDALLVFSEPEATISSSHLTGGRPMAGAAHQHNSAALSQLTAMSRTNSSNNSKSAGVSATAKSQQSQHHSPQHMTPAQLHMKRKRDQLLALQDAAYEVFSYFSHRNLEAIIKLIKVTLEKVRKRIANAMQNVAYVQVGGASEEDTAAAAESEALLNEQRRRRGETPIFRAYAMLAIPNIVMQPSIDEIQQTVAKAVQLVLGITKHINQWKDLKKRTNKNNVKH
jgi:dynein heavy chain